MDASHRPVTRVAQSAWVAALLLFGLTIAVTWPLAPGLGYDVPSDYGDPLYVACEGRLVAVVDGDQVDAAMAALRSHPLGEGAAVIGRVRDDPPGLVLLKTSFGGTRIVDLLVGDPLPRIC